MAMFMKPPMKILIIMLVIPHAVEQAVLTQRAGPLYTKISYSLRLRARLVVEEGYPMRRGHATSVVLILAKTRRNSDAVGLRIGRRGRNKGGGS